MYKVCFSRKDVNSTLVLTIWHEQAMRSKGRSIQRRDYHRAFQLRGARGFLKTECWSAPTRVVTAVIWVRGIGV